MKFRQLPTGDKNLDRVQQNVAAAFDDLTAAISSPVVQVTESTTPADSTLYLLVNTQRGAVRVTIPQTRQNPITVVAATGPSQVTIFPPPTNGSNVVPPGAAVKLLSAGGKLWILSEFTP